MPRWWAAPGRRPSRSSRGRPAAGLPQCRPDPMRTSDGGPQLPGSGTEVTAGTTVTAEINVGPATERIPKDLVGRDVDDVVEELAEAGFSNVTAIPVADPPAGAETDEVVAVDPGEGEKAAPEEDITVSYVGRAVRKPTTGTQPKSGGRRVGGRRRPRRPPRSRRRGQGSPASRARTPPARSRPQIRPRAPSRNRRRPSPRSPSRQGALRPVAGRRPRRRRRCRRSGGARGAADRCRPGPSQPAGRRFGRQSDAPGG